MLLKTVRSSQSFLDMENMLTIILEPNKTLQSWLNEVLQRTCHLTTELT